MTIRFEDVTIGPFQGLTFKVEAGAVCKIVTEAEYEKEVLIQALAGQIQPEKGRIFLFEKDIWAISEKEALGLFQRVGLVFGEGGLVSNLKVWENIALPVWYHKGVPPSKIEARVADLLIRLGFEAEGLAEYVARMPGDLPVHEKQLIALVRALLMEPEFMVYEEMLKQLSPEVTRRVLELTREFHAGSAGRTSLFISPDEQALQDLECDIFLRQQGRGMVS